MAYSLPGGENGQERVNQVELREAVKRARAKGLVVNQAARKAMARASAVRVRITSRGIWIDPPTPKAPKPSPRPKPRPKANPVVPTTPKPSKARTKTLANTIARLKAEAAALAEKQRIAEEAIAAAEVELMGPEELPIRGDGRGVVPFDKITGSIATDGLARMRTIFGNDATYSAVANRDGTVDIAAKLLGSPYQLLDGDWPERLDMVSHLTGLWVSYCVIYTVPESGLVLEAKEVSKYERNVPGTSTPRGNRYQRTEQHAANLRWAIETEESMHARGFITEYTVIRLHWNDEGKAPDRRAY